MSKIIGSGNTPMICAPVVGKDRKSIVEELSRILVKQPDIIEWRADYFEQISNTQEVIGIANEIKKLAGDLSVLFTIRSTREGGQPIPLSDVQAMDLDMNICRHTAIEYIDCELSNQTEDITKLRQVAHQCGTKIVGSYHNFSFTPERDALMEKFLTAEQYQLDVAKVAVMPQNMEDVLTLLSVTLEAKKRFSLPLITMSMGKYGAISRMVGGLFGSSLSFAIADKSSAPGQIPIEDLRMVFDVIEKTIGPLAP